LNARCYCRSRHRAQAGNGHEPARRFIGSSHRGDGSIAARDLPIQSVQLTHVHSVRVRATPDGLVVNYHCRVSPYLCVDEVHEHVDELDRKMRAAFTAIVRIVGHAEPLRA
jgi:divalent metal cation (Fe/Co/Zn/Cd) transporter